MSLEARVVELERRSRRLLGIAVLAGLVGVSSLGLTIASRVQSHVVVDSLEAHEVLIRANESGTGELRVVDRNGKTRVRVGMPNNREPSVSVLSEDGNAIARLTIVEDKRPMLLLKENEMMAVVIRRPRYGFLSLTFLTGQEEVWTVPPK